MDRSELIAVHMGARPVHVEFAGRTLTLWPKEFSTGSLGWHAQDRFELDGSRVIANFTITVIGSKPGWVSSAAARDTGERGPIMPGEQNGSMPEKAPESPPETSPLFGDPKTEKQRRKRS